MQYYRNTGETFDDVKPDADKVNNYLSKASLIKIGDVLVDVDKIINQRWSCQPSLCKNISTSDFHGTCCDGGGILSPNSEAVVERLIPFIEKYLPSKKTSILAEGKILLHRYHINEINDECIFLAKDENGYFCSFHRFAEEMKIPPIFIKPFDCCLSPLDIIVLDDGTLFLTIASPDTVGFIRWGAYMECVQNPLPNSPKVYQATEYYLRLFFGNRFYEELKKYAGELESRETELLCRRKPFQKHF